MPEVRFNCDVIRAEGGEQSYRWQTTADVVRLIGNLEDGDTAVVNAVEDTTEGTL